MMCLERAESVTLATPLVRNNALVIRLIYGDVDIFFRLRSPKVFFILDHGGNPCRLEFQVIGHLIVSFLRIPNKRRDRCLHWCDGGRELGDFFDVNSRCLVCCGHSFSPFYFGDEIVIQKFPRQAG